MHWLKVAKAKLLREQEAYVNKASSDCDSFSKPETPWYRGWENGFPLEYCEVVLEPDGKKHRVDIIGKYGTVIELQHSLMGSKDV